MKERQLHNNLHALRTHASYTQADLAGEVGVTRQTIIAIEKGNYVPSVLLAIKLAGALNVWVEELFYDGR